MTMNFMLTRTTALLITGVASADFIGFDGFSSTNSQGNNVVQMYAVFDNADAVALNFFNADVSITDGEFIHNDVQAAAGCVIGRDYPAPIVDHAVARGRALAAYAAARG